MGPYNEESEKAWCTLYKDRNDLADDECKECRDCAVLEERYSKEK
jgi:hypothetical protein